MIENKTEKVLPKLLDVFRRIGEIATPDEAVKYAIYVGIRENIDSHFGRKTLPTAEEWVFLVELAFKFHLKMDYSVPEGVGLSVARALDNHLDLEYADLTVGMIREIWESTDWS